MNNLTKVLIGTLLLAISFTAGYYATPTKVEEVVKVEYKEAKVETKTKVVYRDRITHPDGTVVEKEVEREDSVAKTDINYAAESSKVSTKAVGLVLSGLVVKSIKDIGGDSGAQIVVSKRLIGALGVTGSFTSYKNEKLAAVGLNWSF